MPRSPNRLLSSLSAKEYRRIAPRLHTTQLSNGSILPLCGDSRVYFPGSGACSILSRMSDGSTIEVASVGGEGGVGLPALGSSFAECSYVHVTHGTLQYMRMTAFDQVSSNSEFGAAVDSYCAEFMRSVMQLVACNRVHSVEARCARWILLTHERIRRAKFELTQPFLAMAVGTKPEVLSPILARMSEQGLVKHDGASVTIVDPIALRRASCRCYETLKAGFSHLIAPRARRAPGRHVRVGNSKRDNVLPMRNIFVCSLCGLGRNHPHKKFDECLRAIDAELRASGNRARQLVQLRAQIAQQSMEKYEKFIHRRRS